MSQKLNAVITPRLIVDGSITVPPASSPLLSGLVSYYKLEEDGTVVYVDQLGFADLNPVNTPSSETVDTIDGNAVSFDELSLEAAIGMNTAVHSFLATSFTIDGWVYVTSSGPSTKVIISKFGTNFLDNEYFLQWNTTNILTFTGNHAFPASSTINSSANVTPNAWHYFAVRYDLGTLSLGITTDSVAITPIVLPSPLFPSGSGSSTFRLNGFSPPFPYLGFTGRLDEVAIWNRYLSDSELALRRDSLEVWPL